MAFSILYWLNYVSGTKKLHQKSELAVKADHVLKFMFDPELNYAQGRVQASMRDRSYHVSVSARSVSIFTSILLIIFFNLSESIHSVPSFRSH